MRNCSWLRSFALIVALVVSAAPLARAQFGAAFTKWHEIGVDDVVDAPPPAFPSANLNEWVHYILRVGNCESFAIPNYTTCVPGVPHGDLTGGIVTDHPGSIPPIPPTAPFVSNVWCGPLPGPDPRLTIPATNCPGATITCDDVTNTVTVTGITLAYAAVCTIDYWAQLTATGNISNQAELDYNENPNPGTVLSDAYPQYGGAARQFVVNVGGGGGAPILYLEPLGASHACVPAPQPGQYQRCAVFGNNPPPGPDTIDWLLSWDNTTGTAVTADLQAGPFAPVGCSTLNCPPTVRINNTPQGWPPAGSTGATCLPDGTWTVTGLPIPNNAQLRVSYTGSLVVGNNACNHFVQIHPPPLPNLGSIDPDPNCAGGVVPSATKLVECLVSPPSVALVKHIQDDQGNDVTTVNDGGTYCWLIEANNNGGQDVTFNLTDDFPPSFLGPFTGNPGQFQTGNCTVTGNNLTCLNVQLATGASDSIRYCGVYSCSVSSSFCNQAMARITDPPGVPDPILSSPPGQPQGPTCPIVNAPNFDTSTKTASITHVGPPDGCLSPGETVHYSVMIENTGAVEATGTVFQDSDQAGTTFVTCYMDLNPAVPCPLPPSAGIDLGQVNPGAPPMYIDWELRVDSLGIPPGSDYCNSNAQIQFLECGGATVNLPTACVPTCGGTPGPNPTINKVNTPDSTAPPLNPGDTITYTLTICNAGTDPADKVVVTDTLDSCAIYVSKSMTIDGNAVTDDPADGDGGAFISVPPDSVTFDIASYMGGATLDPGVCVTAEFQVTASTDPACVGQTIENQAVGTATGVGDYQSQLVTNDISGTPPGCTLTLTKSMDPSANVNPGDPVTFTIIVENTGAADCQNVVVRDSIPQWTTYMAGSLTVDGLPVTDAIDADQGQYLPPPPPRGVAEFPIGGLPAGMGISVTLTFDVRVDTNAGGQTMSNTATATANGGATGTSNTASVVIAPPLVTLDKTATDLNGGDLEPGDSIEYAIEICNNSTDPVSNFSLNDQIPGTMTTLPFPQSGCDTTYVPGSMTLQPAAGAPAALTDDCTDNPEPHGNDFRGCYDDVFPPAYVQVVIDLIMPGMCYTFRFQITLDAACVNNDHILNLGDAAWTIGGSNDQGQSNTTDNRVVTATVAESYRYTGLPSGMANTGGCEFGPRLPSVACSAEPAICSETVPSAQWTYTGIAVHDGSDGTTFFEVPGAACCASGDIVYLTVIKNGNNLEVETTTPCP